LPSGQAIAKAIANKRGMEADEVLAPMDGAEEPLFAYVLREAEKKEREVPLGPMAARIVAEVIIGLLHQAGDSFLHHPEWKPPSSDFALADFLAMAGVPLTEKQWDTELKDADQRKERILRFRRAHVK